MKVRVLKSSLVLLLLVGFPPFGLILAGTPLSQYLEFPPLTRYVQHAKFSWLIFMILGGIVLAVTASLLFRLLTTAQTTERQRLPARKFPWWGWLGLGVLGIAWVLAWSRFTWFEDLQPFTFSPLWLGYILLINALTFRRTGHCMMLNRPSYFLALFPLSAAFWWYFEYLNRFVQNWYYEGIASFTPGEYFLYATLPFATVLPAVLSTRDWLATFPQLTGRLRDWWRIRVPRPTIVSGIILLLGSLGLVGLGVWPDVVFPFLWIAPLMVMVSVQILFGEKTIFADVQHGDWRCVWLPALAGLMCGFLWELWNFGSVARWAYAVPYVHRFSIFEMPLLGYAGYLSFGLECAVAADLFLGRLRGSAPVFQNV